MSVRITQDAWLAELRRLGERADGGLTTNEWADTLGLSTKTTAQYIKAAMKQGWVVRGSKLIESMNGRMVPVATYVVNGPKKGGK